ncbi:MAG TPA: MauE/DoxX family redox-associated membrane protein [Bacteroidia bacterium]|nr:MauE/DoxX family redox-associated membrane protein [Bacteroidia bacterium]
MRGFFMTKQKIFKILLIILSALLGLLFIYSGYTKLFPIEPFEYTFVDLGIVNWTLAPFVARFMIGLEFFIGLMLFFNLYLKKFTIKLTVATLVVFTIYLLVMILREGNNGNCGCFGNAIAMTPFQAVINNIIMLAICFLIYRFHEGFVFGKLSFWLSVLFLLSSMTLPHVLNYVDLSYSEAYLNKPEDKFTLDLDTLYNNSTAPKTLSQGKHVLAFMSCSCMHCRVAAKKMRIMHEKNPAISFYFVLNGDSIKLKQFYADTKTQDFPYCTLKARPFIYLAGTNLPTIYLINNSVVEHWVNYMQLNQTEVENWIKEK